MTRSKIAFCETVVEFDSFFVAGTVLRGPRQSAQNLGKTSFLTFSIFIFRFAHSLGCNLFARNEGPTAYNAVKLRFHNLGCNLFAQNEGPTAYNAVKLRFHNLGCNLFAQNEGPTAKTCVKLRFCNLCVKAFVCRSCM